MRTLAGALAVLGVAVMAAAPGAVPDRKAPRIAAAIVLDRDGDFRADAVRITFTERIRHRADRDGRYPFAVAGYRIRSVGAGSGRTLMILLAERSGPDDTARPSIRYKRTAAKPVLDCAGNQAAAQTFAGTKAHGNAPPPPPPEPPPINRDPDGDGWDDSMDCAPNDRLINPAAQDLPDLAFVDSNCDGIDGNERNAVFVSPLGKDDNPGTKTAPKREIQPAILVASQSGKNVYVAVGSYAAVSAETGVGIYGGYDQTNWSRRDGDPRTVIEGSPQAVLVDDERGIVLQLLTLRGTNGGGSAYGVRALNGSSLTLQRVQVAAAEGAAGRPGANGARGFDGLPGANGEDGSCDSTQTVGSRIGGYGGAGGASGIGRAGGAGGQGGSVADYGTTAAKAGAVGQVVGADGGTGGAGGRSGDPGRAGTSGGAGASGDAGLRGAGGTSTMALAGAEWVGDPGRSGTSGAHGGGGGGGGGGGAQTGLFVRDGPGNGGGGGGAGGAAGRPGSGGGAGGGSFGVYLHNSTIVITSSVVTAANGGFGARGGDGGIGGNGGTGGVGASKCTSEVGRGGNGARGGDGGTGGAGGGGAGGPSIGVMKVGTSTATLMDSRVTVGAGGPGGTGGSFGAGTPPFSQPGVAQAIFPAP